MDSAEVVYCPGKEDVAKRTFFEFDKWAVKKIESETKIRQIIPENVISLMLKNGGIWSEIS